MIQAKLFVIGQEIELLWSEVDYYRDVNPIGKPSTTVHGGAITVCFATTHETDLILRWMTKESTADTFIEVDKMEEGKICFYQDGFDHPPTKTYTFSDAFPIEYSETFNANDENPLQTVMTISPAIQNYGSQLIKHWNVSYLPPSEDIPHQSDQKTPQVEDYYITDLDGNRIEIANIGQKIILNIETKNLIGEFLTISLNDKDADFKYKDEVLPNDTLSDYKVTNNWEKIELEVIEQQVSE